MEACSVKRCSFKPALATAIREGRKTETRRICNPQDLSKAKPAYAIGEIIGICEPWRAVASLDQFSGSELVAQGHGSSVLHYDADGDGSNRVGPWGRRRLARFLPDAFVRTRVRILSVSAERLQNITEEQAQAEGITDDRDMFYLGGWLATERAAKDMGFPPDAPRGKRAWFAELWDRIHPEAPWAANSFVWRYCFEVAP